MYREITKAVFLGGKNVLVVGGTAGIGEAAAITFARHGASVTIAGRNKEAGANVVQQMRDASPSSANARLEFKKLDITCIAEIKQFAREYSEAHVDEALDVLVVSAGGIVWGPRQETSEGIEPNFALNYLGRWMVINQFIPLLSRSENATAMSILRCGQSGEINFDDIQSKKSWSLGAKLQAFKNGVIANDLMVNELGERHPNIHFFHIYPGWVATEFGSRNQLPGNSVTKYFGKWFGTSPQDYSHTLVHICTSPEYKSMTGCGLDAKGKLVPKTAFQNQPGVNKKLWDYSVEVSGINNKE